MQPSHGMSPRKDLAAAIAVRTVLASMALSAAACSAGFYARPARTREPAALEVAPYGDGDVVYVQGPPVIDIEAYPNVLYGNGFAYYVHGRWYAHGPRGWSYYRTEPAELGRHRQDDWGRTEMQGLPRTPPQPERP